MTAIAKHCRGGTLAPDPELWAALDYGKGLEEILNEFYTRVYDDPRLAPFFEGVTKQRAIEKQFSFLRSLFTGERVYFGNHPRNAHHWMVISDDLFDYREELMTDCLRRHGLPENLISRWRQVEETFRKAIVKDKPLPRRVGGVAVPAEGYSECELSFANLCDGCSGEVRVGDRVYYHVRTGKTYCRTCFAEHKEKQRCVISDDGATV